MRHLLLLSLLLLSAFLAIKKAQSNMHLDDCFCDAHVAQNYPVGDPDAPAYGIK